MAKEVKEKKYRCKVFNMKEPGLEIFVSMSNINMKKYWRIQHGQEVSLEKGCIEIIKNSVFEKYETLGDLNGNFSNADEGKLKCAKVPRFEIVVLDDDYEEATGAFKLAEEMEKPNVSV